MAITYCSLADVRYLINTESKGLGTTQLSDATLTEFVYTAEDVINGMIAERYSVPFASGSVPPMIKRICVQLSAYYSFRAVFTRDSINKSDWVEGYWDKIMDEKTGLLSMIAKGKISLVGITGSLISNRYATIESSTENYAPTADIDDPTDWVIDSNRLDDVATERE